MYVESASGAGALFTVVLPLVDEPVEQYAARAHPPRGTETVLLAEDEAVVREVATRLLRRHGYRVIPVRHGGDALLEWRARGDEIDVLVTDLRMPELDDRLLVERLRAERPGFPVVLTSGYASEGGPGDAVQIEEEVFLAKPFSSGVLLARVREALDRVHVGFSRVAEGAPGR